MNRKTDLRRKTALQTITALQSIPALQTVRQGGCSLAEELTDLVYPPRCPICQKILLKEEKPVCPDCRKHLPWIREPRCKKCGRPLEDEQKEYCERCMQQEHFYRQGQCTFVYTGKLRDSLLRMKFENHREYIPFFAQAMALSQGPFLKRIGARTLVPVPLHPQKRKARGFDQCFLLCRSLSQLTGTDLCGDALLRVKQTTPQKGLDAGSRRENLQDAFAFRENAFLQEPVVIVDDIYTTGATIDSAARTLQLAGITDIWFVALCSA